MSFNLLADSKQGQEKWSATPPEALDWRLRRWRILEELLVHHPDILCLQEVDHFDEFFQPELQAAGYVGVLRQNQSPDGDGVAVIFRRSRFRCVDEDLSLRYAALIVLECLGDGLRIVVVSTHLTAGKTASIEAKRAMEAQELLHNVQRISDGMPVLLAGDLNALPVPDAKIGEPLAYRCVLDHPLDLQSAYVKSPVSAKSLSAVGGFLEPPYTTWKKRPEGEIRRTIDFIFHSSCFKVVALLEMPTEKDLPAERVPSFSYPSDHFALAVDLLIA
eukprot:CAMPEP_0194539628 /NCGR_PEP_ID=MMETSP0253-20130528/79631_1 /TAXON_ID=2966 /ORGANISM="Noctiluca scintillans" /LENGTH=274 /DNA_ID=CAMNT_0039385921 /DNA_START=174 /DNA_END=998 /DNA_ORIENTATION=-